MTFFCIPDRKRNKVEDPNVEIGTIFSRASGYIKAHSHPEEQDAPSTLNDLKTDFERFKLIIADFK
jgi:hypothetical protein